MTWAFAATIIVLPFSRPKIRDRVLTRSGRERGREREFGKGEREKGGGRESLGGGGRERERSGRRRIRRKM
jgi:hypothetical protein